MPFDPAACRFFPLGDQAVLVELGPALTPQLNDRVHALCAQLLGRPLPGVIDVVPAYTTLAVHYDATRVALPNRTPFDTVVAWLSAELSKLEEARSMAGNRVEIPVCYGKEFGEDLEQLARSRGLAVEQVVDLHCAPEYRVYLLGFAPGFAYLGGLDARIVTPRRAVPRTRVPAGSVAIGGEQTGVYPIDSPGGWNIIGRTPLRMFDSTRDPACLLAPGDRVKFVPIDGSRFDKIRLGENAGPP